MNETWWVKQGQLDEHQKRIFTLPLRKDYIVKGPPGSGKTNILLLKAKQFIGSNIPNVAVVVHTRTLQEFIKSGAPKYGIPSSKIWTFRKLGLDLLYRIGTPVTLPPRFEVGREVLVNALQGQISAGRLKNEYSCVLVDEAQDFIPEEIEILRVLGECFFGGADSRQEIYRAQDAIKKLEQEVETVVLPFHYRNGRSICTVADGLAKFPAENPSLLETSKYPESKMMSSVEVIPPCSLAHQCSELMGRLDSQIKAYPGEMIGIVCPRGEDLSEVVERLRASPFAEQLVVQTSEDGYVSFDPAKNICTSKLHSAKGLEFRAFHILAAEGLKKLPMQRELAFMGVTRAKTSLCIYHSGELPSYLEEALSKLKPGTAVLGLDGLLDDDEEEVE